MYLPVQYTVAKMNQKGELSNLETLHPKPIGEVWSRFHSSLGALTREQKSQRQPSFLPLVSLFHFDLSHARSRLVYVSMQTSAQLLEVILCAIWSDAPLSGWPADQPWSIPKVSPSKSTSKLQ